MTTTTSDVALHGRHLNEVAASTVGEFTAAVGNSAVDKILLAAGTYELTTNVCSSYSAVCIDRALTIEAEVPGSVVLDAQGSASTERRVFNVQSGGVAELIGLNITGGYTSVCSPSAPSGIFPPSPRWNVTCSPSVQSDSSYSYGDATTSGVCTEGSNAFSAPRWNVSCARRLYRGMAAGSTSSEAERR